MDDLSERRKDSKGRVLRTGESERKDGLYQFRYEDISGKRQTIYDRDLNELRKKEKEIQKQLDEGVSFFDGCAPLCDVLDRAYSLKCKWRASTRETMMRYLCLIKPSKLYNMPVNRIRMSDCKQFLIQLHDEGKAFGTINSVHTLLKMAFQMACEDNALMRNPCAFPIKTIIDDDTPKVRALTQIQQERLWKFLREDTIGKRHLDMFVMLAGTGMRISEFAALTIQDIDFGSNVIHVDKQIVRLVGKLTITEPKSKNGVRDIPMTQEVRQSAMNLLRKRQENKLDVMIDGYVGFLSVTRNGRPRTHSEYADVVRKLMVHYNEVSAVKINRCTPHALRHTFCTKCVSSNMDVKSAQYLMGHSDARTTLNIYTDNVMDKVYESMELLEKRCN